MKKAKPEKVIFENITSFNQHIKELLAHTGKLGENKRNIKPPTYIEHSIAKQCKASTTLINTGLVKQVMYAVNKNVGICTSVQEE